MLVCQMCGSDWNEVGNVYIRVKGDKRDYYCSGCGSKRKPIEQEELDSFKYTQVNKLEDFEDLHNISSKDTPADLYKSVYQATNEFMSFGKHKKILVLSDLHCGHKSGLTPPEWFCNKSNEKRRLIQEESWEWFSETVKSIGKVDALVINGDAIDGKGSRSGGTELITSDLFKQVKIAERCIKEVSFNNIFFTYGTPYHITSEGDDFETSLADKFNAVVKDHLWLDVNGCTFDFKHKINSSSVLQSRTTSLIKEYMWNREWCKNGAAPKSDVFVRSHVHYCNSVTDYDSFFAITTPALQVADTKFGGRICTGSVDYGFVLFEVPEDYNCVSDVSVKVFKKNLESMKSRSVEI